MNAETDDLRIRDIQPLVTPRDLIEHEPATENAVATVISARSQIRAILHGTDPRLLVVVGPCSIHDTTAAMEYAQRLSDERKRHADSLEIVMRIYFEKPRTTVGWKGLINDPYLDGSLQIDQGLPIARRLLIHINHLGLPAGCEFLDMITPQYIADLVSWGAIGARTTESQVHRELASGLSCPVGFKNGTDGNVSIAIDAIRAAQHSHRFLSVTKEGRSAIVTTTGNNDCHVILRGGSTPNYDAESLDRACTMIVSAGLAPRAMIDASHANSGKQPERQSLVIEDIAHQVENGEHRIVGVMVESHLVAGRQDLRRDHALIYGQRITDGCIGWEETSLLLDRLSHSVRSRRRHLGDRHCAQD